VNTVNNVNGNEYCNLPGSNDYVDDGYTDCAYKPVESKMPMERKLTFGNRPEVEESEGVYRVWFIGWLLC